MLAGLEEVSSGTIDIGGRDVTSMPPKDRDIAMVFQNYALYPHMTVADNMGFSLKMAGVSKEDRARRVKEAAQLLGWRTSSTASRRPCPVASDSGWRWVVRSSVSRRSS
jgi:ABC-type sugar transport system ATPase subunit